MRVGGRGEERKRRREQKKGKGEAAEQREGEQGTRENGGSRQMRAGRVIGDRGVTEWTKI